MVADAPPPDLIDGGVRIAVHAAGVNFADSLVIAGTYQEKPGYPFTPGMEVAGEVLECAPGVTGIQPGDRVLAMVPHGGYGEQAVAQADSVFAIPPAMDYVTAAGFAIAYGTAHLGLREKLALAAGETLLVHGAAGGVGLAAVEIGALLGATVIATGGDAGKLLVAQERGAAHVIDYSREDIRIRVKALTGGVGAGVVFDPVGGAAFDASLRSVGFGGRILVIGFASGAIPRIPANILLVKNITVVGFTFGAFGRRRADLLAAAFGELFAWYEAGQLHPRVSHTFPLAEAPRALETVLQRRSTGKVVLVTGD